jgi:c-di-GMP-binding flagellar brake protein YcgR
MTGDRRRSQKERRAAARVAAVFAIKSVARGRLQLGQAEDLSPTGMTVRRPKDLALSPGTGLVLTFALPGNGTMLRLSALVISDRLSGSFRRTGVRFVALAADQQQQIAGFYRSQLAPAYPTAIVA